MATGALDANGIWQYGEDDSNTTFSALLNRLGSSASTQQGSNKTRLTALEAKPLAGLVPVIPTSIDKTGGTSTVSTNGAVTFSGVSSISLNGVFTSTYRNYRILVSDTVSSSGLTSASLVFRAAGSNVSSANYWQWGARSISSGLQLRGANAGTSLDTNMNINTASTLTQASMVMDLFSPQVATPKSAIYTSSGYDGTTNTTTSMSFVFNASNACDGFTITPGVAFSGRIQVFGYKE